MKPESKPTLVVIGDIAADVLVQVEGIPAAGEDAVVRQLSILPGGSAANCAAVAARLGARVKFVGVSGQDMFTPLLHQDLAQSGVDLQHLREFPSSSAVVIAMVDPSGERTFLSYRGVAAKQDYGQIPVSILQAGDILHVSGYAFQTESSKRLALDLMSLARQAGARIALDPSYYFACDFGDQQDERLRGLDYLFPSKEEALLMTRAEDVHQAARRLRGLGVKTVLLKLGGQGCLVAAGDDLCELPAYEVDPVVDLSGAGDAFAGGFLAATSAGCALLEAVSVGQAAAAMVIAQVGGHAGAPHLPQLRDFALQRDDQQLLRAANTMEAVLHAKANIDVGGHYSRPDDSQIPGNDEHEEG